MIMEVIIMEKMDKTTPEKEQTFVAGGGKMVPGKDRGDG